MQWREDVGSPEYTVTKASAGESDDEFDMDSSRERTVARRCWRIVLIYDACG